MLTSGLPPLPLTMRGIWASSAPGPSPGTTPGGCHATEIAGGCSVYCSDLMVEGPDEVPGGTSPPLTRVLFADNKCADVRESQEVPLEQMEDIHSVMVGPRAGPGPGDLPQHGPSHCCLPWRTPWPCQSRDKRPRSQQMGQGLCGPALGRPAVLQGRPWGTPPTRLLWRGLNVTTVQEGCGAEDLRIQVSRVSMRTHRSTMKRQKSGQVWPDTSGVAKERTVLSSQH